MKLKSLIKLPTYKIDKPVRLIELFGGIGAQAKSLQNLGVNFEHYRYIDNDAFAVKSYNAIFDTDFKPQDIKAVHGNDLGIVDKNRYIYILCYSFPCTSISVAGPKTGMKKGTDTESSLLWEVERILRETEELPQVLLMENVTQVHSSTNISEFADWQKFLRSKGYSNFYKDLNAKDYGIPQSRNRCFMISLLGEYDYIFPDAVPLTKTVSDYLEDEVEETYYIDNAATKKFIKEFKEHLIEENIVREPITVLPTGIEKREIADCIQSRYDNGIQLHWKTNGTCVIQRKDKLCLGNLDLDVVKKFKQHYMVYDVNYLAPTLQAGMSHHGGNIPLMIIDKKKTQTIVASRGRNPENPSDRSSGIELEQRIEENSENLSNAITTFAKDNMIFENIENTEYRIRKLTPRECWRLMGFSDEDFDKAEAVNSNSQLYKQAGNSIVVNVLMAIFAQLF